MRIYGQHGEMMWLRTIVYVTFVISIGFLGVYPLRKVRVAFIGFYSAAIGLVLYAIISMGQPFQGLTQVSSAPFQQLNEEIRANRF